MGLGLGGSYGSSKNTTTGSGTATGTSTGTADTTSTYGALQTALQGTLSNLFSTLLPGMQSGTISPNVQAMQASGANQINRAAQGSSDRTSAFLASRGFGQSGQTGQSVLANELSRQSALGANASSAAGMQLQQNQQMLAQALQYAFANPGQFKTTTDTGTTTESSTSSGSASGWKFGGGLSFGA